MKVPLYPPSLVVRGLGQTRPRCPDLLELGAHLGCQSGVLERQPRGRADRLDQPRILGIDRRVVDQDREELPATFDACDRPRRADGRIPERLPALIDQPARVWRGERELVVEDSKVLVGHLGGNRINLKMYW